MENKIRYFFISGLFILFIVLSAGFFVCKALSEPRKRIFMLHSYEVDHVCGRPQRSGVIAALKEAGFDEKNLELNEYYMDTKRKNNTPELIEKQSYIALKKISVFHPQVLVAFDDDAFRTVCLSLAGSPVSIVFSGMNVQPEDYNKIRPCIDYRSHPGHNITGVYEKLYIAAAIRVHSRVFPGLKKVMIFVDTSNVGKAISKQIEIELKMKPVNCAWEIKVVNNWEEYKRAIFSANKDPDTGAIYPAALLLKDRDGKSYTAPEIFAWTIKNSSKPELALNYSFTRLGLFGGAAVDFYFMGYQAGRMVVRILNGEAAGDIPIEDAGRHALVFNIRRAEQLGITIPSDILMAADEVILTTP